MRKLTEKDREAVLSYAMREPEYNIFIIGDIENHGFDKPYMEIFANDAGQEFDCIVLRYMDHFVVYSHHLDFDAKAAAGQIKLCGECGDINGKADIVEKLIPYFPGFTAKTDYLSRLDKVSGESYESEHEIKQLDASYAKAIIDLHMRVDEFKTSYIGKEEKAVRERRFALEHGEISYGLLSGGKLVSTATATAKNSQSAMVIGVCTDPDERGKGYASAVVSKLCGDCLNNGLKFMCLFYDNPAAGRIYRRIGFVETGKYMMLQNLSNG
jgi:predicted GNAT family acetyltransferase